MSGHSKWATIKRKKGANDAARGQKFTKLIKEVHVAARMGGGDLSSNARLRVAVDKAKANSLPRATIERAILKGSGELGAETYEELTYEGYAPGGVAVLVFCLTDNRNRTAAEVRHAFTKAGANLGSPGSVSYMFTQKGVFSCPVEAIDEDTLMMTALDAGADDVSQEDGEWTVVCARGDYDACKAALEAVIPEGLAAQLTWVADNLVAVSGDDADKVVKFIEKLEELDDVQETYSNADIDDADLEDEG